MPSLLQLVPIPNYVRHFPYRQLIIIKVILILCAVFQCILWWEQRQSLGLTHDFPNAQLGTSNSPTSTTIFSTSTSPVPPPPSSPSKSASKAKASAIQNNKKLKSHRKLPLKDENAPIAPTTTTTTMAPKRAIRSNTNGSRWAPVCNLLSLLCTACAAWFMLQKFYWIKLDLCLIAASTLFTFLSLLFCFHFYVIGAQLSGLLFAFLNSLMLFFQTSSMLITVRHAKNCVSNLFIKDWGAAEFSYMEVRELESDF